MITIDTGTFNQLQYLKESNRFLLSSYIQEWLTRAPDKIVLDMFFLFVNNVRIFHEYEMWIEKSVKSVIFRHHEAY